MKRRYLLTAPAVALIASHAFAQPIPRTDPNGTYCREYQQTVMIGGRQRESYGTACQQEDGAWKILPSDVQQQATETTPQIEYVDEPVYVSEPVYMAPPPVYYQTQPYYGPYSYPYAYPSRGYSSFSFSTSFGDHDGYRSGYRHHRHW